MSGRSTSSSDSARRPSVETTTSNPRTARLARIRSTILGSSSTSRTRVFGASSDIGRVALVGVALDREAYREAAAAPRALELDGAAVGVDDAARDRQPEPGAGGGAPPLTRLAAERARDLVRGAGPVVGDGHDHLVAVGARLHPHARAVGVV